MSVKCPNPCKFILLCSCSCTGVWSASFLGSTSLPTRPSVSSPCPAFICICINGSPPSANGMPWALHNTSACPAAPAAVASRRTLEATSAAEDASVRPSVLLWRRFQPGGNCCGVAALLYCWMEMDKWLTYSLRYNSSVRRNMKEAYGPGRRMAIVPPPRCARPPSLHSAASSPSSPCDSDGTCLASAALVSLRGGRSQSAKPDRCHRTVLVLYHRIIFQAFFWPIGNYSALVVGMKAHFAFLPLLRNRCVFFRTGSVSCSTLASS